MGILDWLFGSKERRDDHSEDFFEDPKEVIAKANKEAMKMYEDFSKAKEDGNSTEVMQHYMKKHDLKEEDINGTKVSGSNDYFATPVAGTSFQQKNLATVFDELEANSGTYKITIDAEVVTSSASLILDNNNSHDKNAVKVMISGKHVGYLPRDKAEKYRSLNNSAKKYRNGKISCQLKRLDDDNVIVLLDLSL